MNPINISKEFGTDLSSRTRAAALRIQILRGVARDGISHIDFSSVRTVSDSFADEVFGVLAVEKGQDWFREHIKLINVAALPKEAILGAISGRLHLT